MNKLTVRPINTGFVTTVPKEYLYHHSVVKYYDIPDGRIEMPMFVFLIEGAEKPVLVDTGMVMSMGKDVEEAADIAELVEETAMIAMLARMCGFAGIQSK